MPTKKHSAAKLIAVLNYLVEQPHVNMRDAARQFKCSPVSFYNWSAQSAKDEAADLKEQSQFYFNWMEHTSYWHRHIVLARKLNVLQIDSRLRSAALHNHRELLFNNQTGRPIWQTDPKLAADAQDPVLWEMLHAPRPITDVFKRDEKGALIQAYTERAPNAAILIKAASSLLPEIYGEKSEVNVNVGGVLHVNGEQRAAIPAGQSDFTMLAENPQLVKPATNVLAVADKCESVEEFEQTFGGKRLIEGVLFYNDDGSLQPPLSHIVVVFGSELHRAYAEAGLAVKTQDAAKLIAQGYENDFLKKLAPNAPRPDIEELRRLASLSPKNPNRNSTYKPPADQVPVAARAAPRASNSWEERQDRIGPGVVPPGGIKMV
jgi:hypothetical protein